ncbi:MAG TPA: hypothetical protein PLF88_07630 [Opitutaceae bacterium]|nr:hypothetical protein [Opitutaceae bacterium]HRJ47693.1 hypothetical protein [Opitutaceae bacterium]
MKSRILAAFCVLTFSSVTTWAREEAKPAAPAKPYAAQTKPADAPAEAKAGAKAEDEMGVIPGVTLTRADGTFLGLEVVNGNFKLTFYDKKKKPARANVARATARWNANQKTGQDFTVLNPSGDTALVGTKFVRPPYNFIVFLVLLNEAGDVVENYQVNMRQ